ncbi:adenine nucleotide alpha hydrolase [Aliikangiella sp. G2MR2-5]|uniref:adenine nucleotide alpha hydrolase n=1 Tax=Aliikangiella sp. G2MR2-5 TaxID=2788943 RepID=UPI0018AA924C|nr:adenine nucleotide alpha hydrolase [Aliikangiella sp. G2MR2-5]
MKKLKTVVSWSSGKDSTLTLLRLLENSKIEVVALLTTHVGESIPFQATPVDVVKEQAKAVGLPLILQELPEVFPSNDIYQSLVVDAIRCCGLDVEAVAFGDMFHNGIADYRRSYIEPAGWQCIFPLLGEKPLDLAQEIIQRNIKTFLSTVDTKHLDGNFVGCEYDSSFLNKLPDNIDPCGEDGEFHTLVYDAPCFDFQLSLNKGEVDRKGRYHSQQISINSN